MKLCEKPLKFIRLKRRKYRLDLDFRNVLLMLEELQREDLLPEAKVYRALKCVTRRPPKSDAGCRILLSLLCAVLFDNDKEPQKEKVTDFNQDADLIRAAFWEVYGIDLWRVKLHWQKFSALIGALPGDCRYMEVLNIRAQPVPAANKYNKEQREALIKAKRAYALKQDEEQKKNSYNAGVRAMAEAMIAYADKGSDANGV